MPLRNAVVFVTESAEFIGSAVVLHLLDETRASVVHVDELTYASSLDSMPQATGNPRHVIIA